MTSFLEKTAGYLVTQYGSDLTRICIVLPNRRAGLFLRKFLARKIARTTWSPTIFSIEDFVATLTGLQLTEPIRLLAELYTVHKETEGDKAQPFAEFMNWAPQLLSDFNDVDHYMVDARQLFTYLDEAKAINLWNPDLKPLTDFEKQYLRFYNSLSGYYHKLTARLMDKNQASAGLIFRMAAAGIEQSLNGISWDKIVFAGFSAMTKAEEVIIHHLYKEGKAELLWDADPYYLDDDQQEAGELLRYRLKRWKIKEPKWISDDFRSGKKKIRITGIASNVGQARESGVILSMLAKEGQLDERTAIVLPDERLLLPLLNSIPPGIRDLNITMGFPLRYTPLSGLLETIFRLHQNVGKFNRNKEGGRQRRFYFRDVLDVLQHPYIRQMAKGLIKENYFVYEELISSFRMGNRIFISHDQLTGTGKDLFSGDLVFMDSIFQDWSAPEVSLGYIGKLIEGIRDACILTKEEEGMGSFRLELEYLFAFSKIIHQLSDILASYDIIQDNNTLFRLFMQLAESTTLPFYGEPLKGIQVMGMLETRALDFDNLILLSCNEDLLPTGKQANSFIPFDIRREFQLPTYRQRDSVYAYHFYRLLQRVNRCWLIYNTEPGELGGGDKSRFLKQILNELPGYNPEIEITEEILSSPASTSPESPPISVKKTPEIIKLLEERAKKGFSATSLNAFRRCPLSFYFSEIAGIREPEMAEETIDPRVMGEVVHLTLKNLFLPFREKSLSIADLTTMRENLQYLLDEAFAKSFKGSDIRYGKNLLLAGVAKNLVDRFLRSEEDILEELGQQGDTVKILDLEKYLDVNLVIEQNGRTYPVKLKGIIDRLDMAKGMIRIIDYKTGTVEPNQLRVGAWEELLSGNEFDKPFQLLVYAWLLQLKKINGNAPLGAGIISLKKIGYGFIPVVLPESSAGMSKGEIPAASLEQFGEIVRNLIALVFDSETDFSQTDDPLACRYCSYINVCGR
ncbi:MAG: PD-(D/E)XK nuclease family protein [bacterium]